jgi:hypothetical protein
LAFGPNCRYGQIVKNYRNADQPGRYAPPEMVQAERRTIFGNMNAGEICTSHVEPNNLTIRHFMKRFTRLSVGFSKKLEHLADAVAIHIAYHNFVWRSRYDDNSGKRGRRRPCWQGSPAGFGASKIRPGMSRGGISRKLFQKVPLRAVGVRLPPGGPTVP